MEYENKVVRVQRVFFHTLPDMIENWGKEGYRIINTNQSTTASGEQEIVIFLEREVEEKIKTNYDRIKSMSVEEMAKLLYKTYKKAVVNCLDIDENIKNSDKFLEIVMVKEDFLQWLLQEVSENE